MSWGRMLSYASEKNGKRDPRAKMPSVNWFWKVPSVIFFFYIGGHAIAPKEEDEKMEVS